MALEALVDSALDNSKDEPSDDEPRHKVTLYLDGTIGPIFLNHDHDDIARMMSYQQNEVVDLKDKDGRRHTFPVSYIVCASSTDAD